MSELYSFLSTSRLLKSKYEEKKQVNPSFSIRSWAAQMGFNSHGSLQQVLAGKRGLPKKYLPAVVKSLRLSKKEALYFETLVDFENAKDNEQRNIYYHRMKEIRPSNYKRNSKEVENFQFFNNPLHSILRTMVARPDFKFDTDWIKNKLRINVTKDEILDVMSRLKYLGLISIQGKKVKKTVPHVTNRMDIPSRAVEQYHHKMCLIASEQIKQQTINDREYNSFCMNIDKSKLPEAKEFMKEFVSKFIDEFESPGGSSVHTYQLNLGLFSLTLDN